MKRGAMPGVHGTRFATGAVAAAAMLFGAGSAVAAPGDPENSFGGNGIVFSNHASAGASDDWANDSQVMANGSILVVGRDASFAELRAPSVVYSSSGTPGLVSTTLQGGNSLEWNSIARAADSKLLHAGTAGSNLLMGRVTSAGAFDGTFTPAFSFGAFAVEVQPDLKPVWAGQTGASFRVGRMNSDGSLDSNADSDPATHFNNTGTVTTPIPTATSAEARAIAIQPDGKIVVVGSADIAGNFNLAIARYTSLGALDTTYGLSNSGIMIRDLGGNLPDKIYAAALEPSGKLIVAGTHNGDFAVGRLDLSNMAFNIDTSFGVGQAGFAFTDMGGTDVVRSVAIQPDGKIVAMGDNGTDFAVARYDAAGVLDPTFGGGDGKVTVDSDEVPASAPEVDTAGGGSLAADGDIVLAGKTDPDGVGMDDADTMLIRLQGDPPTTPPGLTPTPPTTTTPTTPPPAATGLRAAALKKCKKKRSKKARKKCRKKARERPL